MAITPEDMGFSRNSEIAFIHSHPDDGHFNTPTEEYKSMGWRLYSNIECDAFGYPRGTPAISGDYRNVYLNNGGYQSYTNYYTYFPYTGNIYYVRGMQYPAFIRNITNHNNNSNRLFWGILNGK